MTFSENPREPESPSASPATPLQDPLGIICCGALAFILSSVAHEVIGHGGAAWLTGARILRISSVYFDAADAKPVVDAGGPIMNLLVGGLLWLWARTRRPTSGFGRLLVCAMTALNLFWGFGYFFFSGVVGRGDWAFLFKESASPWVWRSVLIAVGLYGYRRSITVIGRMMAPYAPVARAPARPLFRPAILLYLSAGATCCFAALFYRGPVGRALHESAIESFGAFLGLWFVAPPKSTTALFVHRDWRWTVASVAVAAVYVATMGRGYFG